MTMTVLIVDDHARFRTFARSLLEARGTSRLPARRPTVTRRSRPPRSCSPTSCSSTSTCRRSTASRSRVGSPSQVGAEGRAHLQPAGLGLRGEVGEAPVAGFLPKQELSGEAILRLVRDPAGSQRCASSSPTTRSCFARDSSGSSARRASTWSARSTTPTTSSPGRRDQARRRHRRHPDAADPHRRGPRRGAADRRRSHPESVSLVLSQYLEAGYAHAPARGGHRRPRLPAEGPRRRPRRLRRRDPPGR